MSEWAGGPNTYDELPYESRFVAASHPDRLATMAVLHGLKPPDVARCRVLELGCADGGSLLTMAQSVPGGTFVGVELSKRQVDEGRAMVERLGFGNVDLRPLSLMDVDDSFGTFDYIISHGVYSWVPAEARAKILDVCARNLAPGGVAYVSYNTYPGWHLRGIARDAMRFHAEGLPAGADAKAQVREARGFLDLLAASATPADGVYQRALKHEAELIGRSRDTYLFHEHLEPDNHPLYLREFAAEAAKAGLRHFAPARFDIIEAGLSPEVRGAINRLGGDRLRRDQYTDFVVNRTFRQSLLCHADARPSDDPLPEALPTLRLTALARPEAQGQEVDVRSDSPVGFVSLFGDHLGVGQPLLKAAVVALCERWPRSAGFDELWSEALARLGRPRTGSEADRGAFATFLLQGHMTNLVNLHAYDPPVAPDPSERPVAPPLVRHQAAANARVISLRLCAAALDDLDRLVVPLLDGSRDRAAVVEELAARTAAGVLQIQENGVPVRDLGRARALLADPVLQSLQKVAGEALLIADG